MLLNASNCPLPAERSQVQSWGDSNAVTGESLMEPGFAPSEIDTSRPHPARMYNYYLGGKDYYLVDREAAAEVLQAVPEVRDIARENRAFLRRVVRYLVGEAGIRQIIDIGTGIPSAGNVHEIAQQIEPGVRVAYVDNDPIVHVHANALLAGQGNTSIVLADLREPEGILSHPLIWDLIDPSEPVALLLIAVMHFITDQDGPGRIIATLRDALAPGSYLALSHGTADFHDETAVDTATAVYSTATAPLVFRSHAQITALFEGWDFIEPGLVQLPLWRPDSPPLRPRELAKIGIYGGVGRLS
jgi:S-adenosyl methyltransferase